MDYNTQRRQPDEIVGIWYPSSPGFKLILVCPVERSVATGLPCEHGQESCCPLHTSGRLLMHPSLV